MINTHPLGYFLENNNNSKKIDKLPTHFYFNIFKATCHRFAWIIQRRAEILAELNIISTLTKETCCLNNRKTENGLINNIKSQKSGLRCSKVGKD